LRVLVRHVVVLLVFLPSFISSSTGYASYDAAWHRMKVELPAEYASSYDVIRVIPIQVDKAEYLVFELRVKPEISRGMPVEEAVLVLRNFPPFESVTCYFTNAYFIQVGEEVRFWTDSKGKTIAAYLDVFWDSGGSLPIASTPDILEFTANGVLSLQAAVEGSGFTGWVDKPVLVDYDYHYPDMLFIDLSIYTSIPGFSFHCNTNYVTFPRILRVERQRVYDITSEIDDKYKKFLVENAEKRGFRWRSGVVSSSWSYSLLRYPDSPERLSEMYEQEYLSSMVTILATYYSVGWKDEGIRRVKELAYAREWEFPFAGAYDEDRYSPEAIVSSCIEAVEEVFAAQT